jgi:hypothetical protein
MEEEWRRSGGGVEEEWRRIDFKEKISFKPTSSYLAATM